MESWPCGEPAFNSKMLVRGVIIHEDVHLQVLRHALLNLPEKTQILLMPVALSTFREHLAVRRVQRGKQRGGSVASIIVGHSFDITQSQRQHRLGAFQRLNSALLIHAQTTAFSGRFKYNPTISRTLSIKNGSLESLNCFCRCGRKPNACKMRCTVDFDTPVSTAICRILQCVPALAFVFSVLRTNCATRSSLIGRGRPGRNSSYQ
jgi:hypothetical protein